MEFDDSDSNYQKKVIKDLNKEANLDNKNEKKERNIVVKYKQPSFHC